jgi:hypothetical protein
MAHRLARVIDRARSIEVTWPNLDIDAPNAARVEMRNLERRRNMCSWSINCCTLAVIVSLFVEELFKVGLVGDRDIKAV